MKFYFDFLIPLTPHKNAMLKQLKFAITYIIKLVKLERVYIYDVQIQVKKG